MDAHAAIKLRGEHQPIREETKKKKTSALYSVLVDEQTSRRVRSRAADGLTGKRLGSAADSCDRRSALIGQPRSRPATCAASAASQ